MTECEKDDWLKDANFRKLYSDKGRLIFQDDIVWHRMNAMVNLWRIRSVLPPKLQNLLLRACHDQFGHQRRNRTFYLIKFRGYWPGMRATVENYVGQCERYQKAVTVGKIIKEQIFDKFGAPERLLSDQGKNLLSSLIKQLCNGYGVDKARTSAYHPQGNGCCEIFNRTLHGLLVTLDDIARKKWQEHVSEVVAQYNSTPPATTGYSPFHLLFGREAKLPRDPIVINGQEETPDEWVSELSERNANDHLGVSEKGGK
ncbi:uncharacterized protein LOC119573546 [Penaeus monodon]|uniref:uncharacterized protein LOC119573546 n=1 Tax=Penaeus monodon TaxID=6687 RepID=UPI0018A78CD3|nr:uncharacterized protein LOC119573546 [Penaeus monodon]